MNHGKALKFIEERRWLGGACADRWFTAIDWPIRLPALVAGECPHAGCFVLSLPCRDDRLCVGKEVCGGPAWAECEEGVSGVRGAIALWELKDKLGRMSL